MQPLVPHAWQRQFSVFPLWFCVNLGLHLLPVALCCCSCCTLCLRVRLHLRLRLEVPSGLPSMPLFNFACRCRLCYFNNLPFKRKKCCLVSCRSVLGYLIWQSWRWRRRRRQRLRRRRQRRWWWRFAHFADSAFCVAFRFDFVPLQQLTFALIWLQHVALEGGLTLPGRWPNWRHLCVCLLGAPFWATIKVSVWITFAGATCATESKIAGSMRLWTLLQTKIGEIFHIYFIEKCSQVYQVPVYPLRNLHIYRVLLIENCILTGR